MGDVKCVIIMHIKKVIGTCTQERGGKKADTKFKFLNFQQNEKAYDT